MVAPLELIALAVTPLITGAAGGGWPGLPAAVRPAQPLNVVVSVAKAIRLTA
jgi:hypothetical protein